MAKRFDSAQVGKVTITPQGFLRAPATVTRTGVLKYRRPDGSIYRELRHPDEVFHPDSLASLKGLPLTNEHPTKLLDSTDARPHVVGYTGDGVSHDDSHVHLDSVTVFDQPTIDQINGGKQQLSLGYDSEMDETPGEWNGEKYDAIQKNIRYNHLSVVPRARCGPTARIHMDAADAELVDDDSEVPNGDGEAAAGQPGAGAPPSEQTENNSKGGMMDKIVIDGKEYACSPELAQAFAAFSSQMDGLKASMDALKPQAEKGEQVPALEQKAADAEAKADALQAKLDAAEAAAKTAKMDGADEASIQKRVQARIALEKTAAKVLTAETKLDAMSDQDVRVAVIKARDSKFDAADKSEAYVAARFDAEVAMLEKSEEVKKDMGRHITRARMDGAEEGSAAAARKKSMDEAAKEWQQPLSASKK